MNKIFVYGEGKYGKRQKFTDGSITYTGFEKDALGFFQKKYISKTIIFSLCPKKRTK